MRIRYQLFILKMPPFYSTYAAQFNLIFIAKYTGFYKHFHPDMSRVRNFFAFLVVPLLKCWGVAETAAQIPMTCSSKAVTAFAKIIFFF